MALAIVLILIFLICVAMLWNEGTWSNAITLVNVLLAGLLATNYFEPAASFLEQRLPQFTYLLDYLAMWGVFFLSFTILRAVTDAISKTQVKFKLPIEQTGRVLTAAAVGWVVVCFTLASLHTAPLARTAFRGGFQAEPMSNNFLGMAPDRMWLGFVQSRSEGALALSPPRAFDGDGEFIFKYGGRRQRFSEQFSVAVEKNR